MAPGLEKCIGGGFDVRRGSLDDPHVLELLNGHQEVARLQSPPVGWTVPEIEALRHCGTRLWTAWSGAILAGTAALKGLGAGHGEVKALHTAETMRGQGVATCLLEHIIATARLDGMTRLSLETGSSPYFTGARRLYARLGFTECEPFAPYHADPNSYFMTLVL
ncbi:MAG TPA: GNAT family N-acetyltransferase [Allosphingosinicella sp.]